MKKVFLKLFLFAALLASNGLFADIFSDNFNSYGLLASNMINDLDDKSRQELKETSEFKEYCSSLEVAPVSDDSLAAITGIEPKAVPPKAPPAPPVAPPPPAPPAQAPSGQQSGMSAVFSQIRGGKEGGFKLKQTPPGDVEVKKPVPVPSSSVKAEPPKAPPAPPAAPPPPAPPAQAPSGQQSGMSAVFSQIRGGKEGGFGLKKAPVAVEAKRPVPVPSSSVNQKPEQQPKASVGHVGAFDAKGALHRLRGRGQQQALTTPRNLDKENELSRAINAASDDAKSYQKALESALDYIIDGVNKDQVHFKADAKDFINDIRIRLDGLDSLPISIRRKRAQAGI